MWKSHLDTSPVVTITKEPSEGIGVVLTENAPAPPLLDALHRTGIFDNLYIGSQ